MQPNFRQEAESRSKGKDVSNPFPPTQWGWPGYAIVMEIFELVCLKKMQWSFHSSWLLMLQGFGDE